MNDTLLKSYNRSFNGGKSRFARICDNVFSALLLTAALYLLVSRKLHHGAASLFAAMLISASILLTASLLRSLRFNAHIKKLRRETSESILRRRILVSPEVDEVIRSLHRSSSEYPNQVYPEQSATRSFYLLRTEKAITFDDILPIIREALEKGISHIVIYSVSKPEPEAESAVRTIGARRSLSLGCLKRSANSRTLPARRCRNRFRNQSCISSRRACIRQGPR